MKPISNGIAAPGAATCRDRGVRLRMEIDAKFSPGWLVGRSSAVRDRSDLGLRLERAGSCGARDAIDEAALCITEWLPFTGAEGQPRVALSLSEQALKRAGYDSVTSIVPDGQLIPKIEHGDFDGSAALWRSAEREQFLLYSKPYLENRLVLVARKGSAVSARSFTGIER